MQKSSLIIIFSFSGILCGASFASLNTSVWPSVTSTRGMAAVISEATKNKNKDVSLPRSYKIASAFRRSKAIWGVYDKLHDQVEADLKPGHKIKTIKTSLGELILKNGQVVLVSPLSHDGVTQVEVTNLPYVKSGKNQIKIDLDKASDEQKASLSRLYAPLIDGIEGHENAEINQMSCLKKNSRLSCELSLSIQ